MICGTLVGAGTKLYYLEDTNSADFDFGGPAILVETLTGIC